VTDKKKIAELTECVVDALNFPPKPWSGFMAKRGVFKHWTEHFCDSLEKCGYKVNRDAVASHHFGCTAKEASKANPFKTCGRLTRTRKSTGR
jgi:hypothetical protein